jgi:hypothetical protein
MLTGHTPFQADSAGEVFALVLHTDPPPMGLGRDVELVVRRGLAKSNRNRFPSITDFSDALRAAAAGRLLETQWAATLAYAAGEVASHDSKERSGRRARGMVLAVVVAASITIAFVVGREWNRRASFFNTSSRAEAAQGITITAIAAQPDAQEAESRDAQVAQPRDAEVSETQPGAQPPPDEEAAAAPEQLPSAAHDQRPRRVRRAAPWASPRPLAPASPSVDDDATLPATEPSN